MDSPEDEPSAYGEGAHDPESGARHGTWRFYYDDGTLQSEIDYVEGRRQGLCRIWHRNGERAAEEHYVDGVKDGPYRDWWDDGSPRRRGDVRGDAYAGRWWFRNRDGTWYEADMVDGETHGLTRYFGPNDMLFAIAEWDHGTRLWQIIRVPEVGWRRVTFDAHGEPDDPDGELLDRHPCPCCGYLTFPRELPDDPDDEDAQCAVCGWISDFVQNNHPKASGMPNLHSLIESRQNYAEVGAAVPGDDRVRPPHEDEIGRP